MNAWLFSGGVVLAAAAAGFFGAAIHGRLGDFEPKGSAPARAASRQEILEYEADIARRHHEALEARFRNQGTDAVWRAQTESALAGAVSAVGSPDIVRQEVQCRSDMCKTIVHHTTPSLSQVCVSAFTDQHLALEHHFRYESGRTIIYSLRAEPAPMKVGVKALDGQ